jgi:hypothetical protein
MTAAEFFLAQHARLHAADVADPASYWDRTLAGLTDAEMRARPAPGLNSVAWILWHVARTEDVTVNLVVTAGRQVWGGAWATRLGVERADIGTGMTDAEVTELTRRLDLAAARAYRSAVGRRTREVVSALPDAAWAEIVGPADTGRAVAAGALGPSVAGWVEKVWQDVTRGSRLGAGALAHIAMHLGEAVTIRGLGSAPRA